MIREAWIFTFGAGQEHEGYYVKVLGDFNTARDKMCAKYGTKWGFQYSEQEWESLKNSPNRHWEMEKYLETIE